VLRLNHYDVPELQKIVSGRRACSIRRLTMRALPRLRGGSRDTAYRQSFAAPRAGLRRSAGARAYPTSAVAQTALNLLEVDRFGLDEIDQKIMRTVREKFGGGPVGCEHDRGFDR